MAICIVLLASSAAGDPVDDYVRAQMKTRRLLGVSLAGVKDGRVVKAEGYGVASLELNAPVTTETVYEIGSISQQIAADALLLLVEDGKVGLDDLLSGDRPAVHNVTFTADPVVADLEPLQVG